MGRAVVAIKDKVRVTCRQERLPQVWPANMQPTNWNDLQDFLAIARAGKLSAAARASGVDPTTMGRRLRRLEDALGRRLFEQTREGQLLTEAGEALLDAAEAMERAATGIEDVATTQADGIAGTLRISMSEGFGSSFVAPRLAEFAAAHPRLTLDLAVSSGFLNPSKREADIAILLSRPRAGPLIAGKLSDYALRLYATPTYLAARPPVETPRDLLTGHTLVGYVPDLLFAPELAYLSRLDADLEANLRSTSIAAQQALVGAGAGIGVLPCFMGDADANLRAVLPNRRITRSFWLVMHRDTHRSTRVQAFRKWLLALVKKRRSELLPPAD